jgi:hypothetical protein
VRDARVCARHRTAAERQIPQWQVGPHRGLTLEDGTLVVTGNYLKVRIAPGRGRNEWVDLRLTDVTDTIRGEILTPSA